MCESRRDTSSGWQTRPLASGIAARALREFAAVAAAVSVLTAGACASQALPPMAESQAASGAARLVDPDEFAAVIAEPGRVTLNVHVPFEGDIPGTDLSIPFNEITEQAGRLPADRGARLAIYCRSGPMSATAAEKLRDLGYTEIVELRGGMRAWQADGRQLIGL